MAEPTGSVPVSEAPAPTPPAAAAQASPGEGAQAEDADVAAAQRLARIIVSDIVLYNAERVDAGLQSGDLAGSLAAELAEGRTLLAQRVPARVRDTRDFLLEELERVAAARGGQG